VSIDFINGQCVPRSQAVAAERMIRVDAAHDSVEISAPAGGPKKPPSKLIKTKPVPKFTTPQSATTKKAAAAQKSVVPFDQLGAKDQTANAISSANAKPTAPNPKGKQSAIDGLDDATDQTYSKAQIVSKPQATPQPVEVQAPNQAANQADNSQAGPTDLTPTQAPPQQAPQQRSKK
jgi:hypothetical protein